MTCFSWSDMTRALRSGPASTRSMAASMADIVMSSPAAGGEQRRLVHEVGQVGAGEAGRAPGQHVEADVVGERLALGVDVEDRLAALEVGLVDHDLAVEAARTQQRRVEDVGPVGGGDEDHAGAGVEAVHLHEQLVERLLALVVTPAEAGAAVAADGVDLVHEDDGRAPACLAFSKRSRTRLAPTPTNISTKSEPEIGKNGTPASPATARARSVLPVPGRPEEQHALGDPGAHRLEPGRVLEEVLDLLQLLDRLVAAGHVGERHDGGRPS